MPLFMDVHRIEGGVDADDTVKAHAADLRIQGKYGVRYLRYWVSKEAGRVFCLVEAPDANAATTVHREARGLVADEIWRVEEGSFLLPGGRRRRAPIALHPISCPHAGAGARVRLRAGRLGGRE